MKRLFAGIIFTALAAWGQKGFDVISIKPSDPLSTSTRIGISRSGSFEASGVTAQGLIQQAYGVREFQISGAPGWLGVDRYNILTKDEAGGTTEEELGKMSDAQREAYRDRMLEKLRLLLADRFQLKVHKETKELPVYGLMVAKNGPKLQPPPDDGKPGGNLSARRNGEGKTEVTGDKLPIANLARFLSSQVGRPIVDQTGLTGKYSFSLVFAPDMGDINGPSLFTALQEQLGLRLDSQKGPVETIVIDSVQKPTEN